MRLYLSSFRLGRRPEELVRLLDGGRRAGVVANADDYKSPQQRAEGVERELADLRGLGLEAEEIDLRDHFEAGDGLGQRLEALDLLWVRGGNAFILRRAFRQSGADRLLPDLLRSEAMVYAGYSAGGSMLGPTLRGAETVDDPTVVPPHYDPEVVWDCLGLIPYKIVPHYRSDHPESAAVEQMIPHLIDNHVPFIALRDGEAIVIEGERAETVG